MSKEKMSGDYQKTRNVIMSCNNWEQLRVGIKMYNQLNKLHKLPEKDLDKLENLIGLMKIKCKSDSSYDVPQKVDEKSSIGSEFHKAAQASGVQDLRSIVFSEDKDILKEINIGTQIEQNHLTYDEAKELATQNVSNVPNYYTDPNYCIIAVENKNGDKKTVRVEKSVYEKSKKGEEQLITDDMEIYHEDLDSNRISDMLRNKRKKENRRRESPREFEQIRRVRDEKPDFEDEIEEATGAASSGAFVAPLGGKTIRRTFKKSEIPELVGGVPKGGMNKPIGSIYSFNEEKEVLEEEEELDEATTVGSVGGQYVTPKFWAKGKGNWRNRVKKAYPGGKFVNIKKKCKTYPYCDQGSGGPSGSPITLSDTSEMDIDGYFNEGRVVKTIKKGNLKIK
jgi:hypothetical protein